MGLARLGFLATCLSDPLISGFTTGTAVVVVITQVTLILQVPVTKKSGLLATLKVSIETSLFDLDWLWFQQTSFIILLSSFSS